MTEKIFSCLSFWKMSGPLISQENPGIGETIFKLECRSASFEEPLGHASGDFFRQLECGV